MKTAAERGPRRVESRQNSRIKELRAALVRGARTPHIAVEGLHLIEEAMKSGLKLQHRICSQRRPGAAGSPRARGRRSVDRDRGSFPKRHHAQSIRKA